MGFEVEPRNLKKKKVIEFYTGPTKNRFPNICDQLTFISFRCCHLICDLMGNSTHVHVHVQVGLQSTKTRQNHIRSSELPCSFFKFFRVSDKDWADHDMADMRRLFCTKINSTLTRLSKWYSSWTQKYFKMCINKL